MAGKEQSIYIELHLSILPRTVRLTSDEWMLSHVFRAGSAKRIRSFTFTDFSEFTIDFL